MEVDYSTVVVVIDRNEDNCHAFYTGGLLMIPCRLGTKTEQRPSDPKKTRLALVPHSLKSGQNLLWRKDMGVLMTVSV